MIYINTPLAQRSELEAPLNYRRTNMNKIVFCLNIFAFLLLGTNVTHASPTVYIPLGSGNQVIAVDAATDKITATYSGVINAHG